MSNDLSRVTVIGKSLVASVDVMSLDRERMKKGKKKRRFSFVNAVRITGNNVALTFHDPS